MYIILFKAGIMCLPYTETKDGFEWQWQVNYLSHFLLTSLLLPLVQAAGTPERYSRIVNVSSCVHQLGSINLQHISEKYKRKALKGNQETKNIFHLFCRRSYVDKASYSESKLAQVMFTKVMQQELSARGLCVSATSVHPGIIRTDIFDTTWIRFLSPFFYKV